MENRKRPIGLTILAIINFTLAALYILCFEFIMAATVKGMYSRTPIFIILQLAISGLLLFFSGIGFLGLRCRLGYILGNIFAIGIILGITTRYVIIAFWPKFISGYLDYVYPMVLLLLLNLKYKNYFRRGHEVSPKKEVKIGAIVGFVIIILSGLFWVYLNLSLLPAMEKNREQIKQWDRAFDVVYSLESVIREKVFEKNEVVKQFEELYPGSFQAYSLSISLTDQEQIKIDVSDEIGSTAEFATYFYQRYILTLKISFKVSRQKKDVTWVGEPELEIVEPSDISGEHSFICDFNKVLSSDEWQKIVDAKGDISAVVPNIKKNQPVDNFRFAFPQSLDD